MSEEINCPQCGHRFPPAADDVRPVHAGVVRFLTEEYHWTGAEPTEALYRSYLYSAGASPVSRARFVEDLAYLGVPEVRGQDSVPMLVRR